jgi:hypothetical protein
MLFFSREEKSHITPYNQGVIKLLMIIYEYVELVQKNIFKNFTCSQIYPE